MKLATRITIVMVVFTLSGAGLGTYYSSNGIKKNLQATISKSQVLETDQVMDKIDRFLYERTIDIQVVSERDQLQQYLERPDTRTAKNKERLITQFNDFRITAGVWGDMTVLDPQGNKLITTDGAQQIDNLTAQRQFQAAFKAASNGQLISSDVFLEADGITPIEIFMAPIRSQASGRPIIGVIVGELAWSTVLQVLGHPGNDITAHLLNRDGYILGSSNSDQDVDELLIKRYADSKVFKAASKKDNAEIDSGLFPSLDDPAFQVLSTYEHERGYLNYKGNDWLLVFETPANVAFAPAINLARAMIISSVAISVLLLCGILWYLYHSVIYPLRRLRTAMFKIIEGNLKSRIVVKTRDEFGEVGNAFNQMAEGLQTSGQKLHEEHARLKAAIDSLDVGLLMTFKDDEAISYNTMLPYILGFNTDDHDSQPEITLATLRKKLLPSSFDLLQAIESCQKSGKFFEVSEITYDKRILSIFGAPIKTQGNVVIGTVVLIEDITEAKIMERSKDEFFSIASHELRTPLTSIKGNSSMILDFYKDILKDPQLKEMVDDMHTSAVRLIEIVNDFLDLSRLEQGKMSFDYQAVNIEQVIESVAYEMKAVLHEKKIYLKLDRLTLNELPPVWVDANRLKQVVYNLVGNASKFTDKGGITISAQLDPGKKFVKVLVTDTGRGMTPESQLLLFHKFQQASSSLLTRDTTRGTGLGLYISKMIVENMGGVISLDESIEGKGSVFSFTVPIATKAHISAAEAVVAPVTDSTTGLTTLHKERKISSK